MTKVKDNLCGVELIVSDAHEGLQATRKAVFPSVPWQRCQFHLQQNAGHYVPKVSMRAPLAADIRAIFNAPDGKRPSTCWTSSNGIMRNQRPDW